MFTRIHSAALNGLTALPVAVEINAFFAKNNEERLSSFFMVGLPDNAVRESKQRVLSALANAPFRLPTFNVTVNFAPADVRKEGSGFDLPLAIALLKLSKHIQREDLEHFMFVGELGLDGGLRPIKGALPIAIEARKLGYETLFVPQDNAHEAGVVNQLHVIGVSHLSELVDHLNGKTTLSPIQIDTRKDFYDAQNHFQYDFSEVKGQESVKRAFEVAAAGAHNILLIGSPGCGKSMMAKRLPSILPPLTLSEALETTQIYSIAGKMGHNTSLLSERPFRSPHHTISDVALIGGGATLQPGEISLSHHGILFLDELAEFSKNALETLRQPLEDRKICISRAKYTATLPASFMLVAAMNPCPCGYYNDPTHTCTCHPGQIARYLSKISGPLLDRIDLQIEVTPVPLEDLQQAPKGETSEQIRQRVVRARAMQTQRFAECPHIHCNAQMGAKEIEQFVHLTEAAQNALTLAMKQRHLSARAYERILKMARTIADLAQHNLIEFEDISEAVGYRSLDRSEWGEHF